MIELRTRILSLFFVVATVPATACGGDDEKTAALGGAAQQGESCRARFDCAAGLACVGNVCSVGNFPLEPINRECVAVECKTATDCCPTPSPSCATYKSGCDSGITSYCSLYQTQCLCTEADWACENDLCEERCISTTDCSLGTCVNSKCAECASDDQCGTTATCKNGHCESKCETNDDCEYFHECKEGACEETGCKNDRECQAAMSNVLSACIEKECKTPCQTDVECDQPRDYDHSKCINGYCIDVGCESDEECRILLNVQAGRGTDAVCREKTAL